jgi:hypothetical protein
MLLAVLVLESRYGGSISITPPRMGQPPARN